MEIQDTIDAYVKGQLSAVEKADFETAVQNDPALADAVEQARFDLNIANLLIENEVRDWMQEWENTPPPSEPPSGRTSPIRIFTFSLLILIIGVGIWFLMRAPTPVVPAAQPTPEKSAPTPRQDVAEEQQPSRPTETAPDKKTPSSTDPRYLALAEGNFKGSDKSSFMRKAEPGQTQAPDVLQEAAEAIGKKKYPRAIGLLRTLPATHSEYVSAQILLGESYFLQQRFPQAEQAYSKALQSGKVSPDAVEWDLLMTYLAQYGTKKSDFDRLLKKILADTDHPDYDQAVKLEKALK